MRSKEEFQWAAHAKLLSSSVGQNIAFSSGPSSSTTGRLLLDLKQHQNKMSLWGIRDSRNRVVQVQHDSQDGKWINFICFKQTGSAENLNKENPRQTCTTKKDICSTVWNGRLRLFFMVPHTNKLLPRLKFWRVGKTLVSRFDQAWHAIPSKSSFNISHRINLCRTRCSLDIGWKSSIGSSASLARAKPNPLWSEWTWYFSFWNSNLRQPHPKCARGCIGGSTSSWLSFPSFLPIFQFLPLFPFLHDSYFCLLHYFFDRPPAIISW